MFEALYRFLIKHRTVDIPGVGTIVLQSQPSQSAFVNRSFIPPSYTFFLQASNGRTSETLVSWLANEKKLSLSEAQAQFNNFINDFKNRLDAGKEVKWNGIGIFCRDREGHVSFQGIDNKLPFLEEVVAKKVIRENAEHTMLVGEIEKTSSQMTEILSAEPVIKRKGRHWWLWPVAAIIILLIFLGWYFSQHGMSSSSTGNNHKISIPSR